ncbi:MAG: hypothetical protein ACXWVI_09450 [Methyloceanibacter sp.]
MRPSTRRGKRAIRPAPATVLLTVAAQSLFLVFLTVFLFNHANPKGNGMEMVGVGAAFMFIFLPSPRTRATWWLPPCSRASPRSPIRHLVRAAR